MTTFKVTYENGDSFITSMNASLEQASEYYVGNGFIVAEDELTGEEITCVVERVEEC